jgi:hypothetical protein
MSVNTRFKVWNFTNLQRNVGFSVVRNHFSDLPYITVAIFALMESKSPVWHHGRETGKGRILYSHVLGAGTRQEIEINNATEGIVLKEFAVRVIDLDIHTLGAGKEHTMGTVLTSVIKVNGVGAVEVGSWGSTVRIAVPQLIRVS